VRTLVENKHETGTFQRFRPSCIRMRRLHANELIERSIDVLIVDPIASDARRTATALRRAIPNSSSAHVMHAEQALRLMVDHGLFTEQPQLPRLILLEVSALADGKNLLKRICTDERTRNVPVVVFSSTREPLDIEDSYLLGARAHVMKPLDPTEYESEVERVVILWLSADSDRLKSADRQVTAICS
jgi:two-component system, response regulator